jgi:hypothetical protein
MKVQTIAVLGLCAAGSLLTQQALAKKGGTSILHLTISTALTSSGFDDNASGSVVADHKAQGGAEKQSLRINAAGLEANTAYLLLASTTEDTNLTQGAVLTTDANGVIDITYAQQGQGKAHPHAEPLPASLDPVSKLRMLEVSIGGTQTVLSADMTAADKLQYLVKRSMTNDGTDSDAAASLRIKSNGNNDQLRIRASGLDSTNTYFLAINGLVADTFTSTDSGGISITAWPAGSPGVLDVTDLAIWSSASNSVLSTTLP